MSLVGGVLAGLSLAIVGIEGALRYVEMLRAASEPNSMMVELVNPQAMMNWRGLLINLLPGIPGELGSQLVLVLGALTMLAALPALKGEWDPSSWLFPRQMLIVMLATLIAVPHSHFHGSVLALPAIAMALSRGGEGVPLEGVWRGMLLVGFVLGLVLFPLRELSWLLVPYSLSDDGTADLSGEAAWQR